MRKKQKPYLIVLVLILWAIVFFLDHSVFQSAVAILTSFIKEMLQVLPFVLILSALVSEWIPAETVKRHLGEDSGSRGALFAYLLGSLSAGPIYAAFPVALALKKKGASVKNLTILISTWAVIKIPMLFMELKSLGPRFTLIRYCLTLPSILLLGMLMDKLVKKEAMSGEVILDEPSDPVKSALACLPGKNCGGCGFGSCEELARALKGDKTATSEKCILI